MKAQRFIAETQIGKKCPIYHEIGSLSLPRSLPAPLCQPCGHFLQQLFLKSFSFEENQAFRMEKLSKLQSWIFRQLTRKYGAMKKKFDSDEVIESLISAALGEGAGARERHLYRESLRSLVRLAKAEQVVEIKASVKRLTGAIDSQSARRRAKAILLAQQLPGILSSAQQKFEFKD
ncbi:hypothetical protein [Noviherbaspirillum sp. Root189]|uniref:hypothetical protein n=1 Tax=Noviherbaspirillum sp. Root189 TaxID=1736487 RepID=UPI000710AF61|nr:hypothetical protein [Noviherbaspirillum sp. Root189]KRB70444.1 hypothetical protein ASE07_07460 [Noviherbaspirillum sp. Root189]